MNASVEIEGYGTDTITRDIVVSNDLFKLSASSAGLDQWNEWYEFHKSKVDDSGLWPIHLNHWLEVRGIETSLEVIVRGRLGLMCRIAVWVYRKCQKYSVPAFWDRPEDSA